MRNGSVLASGLVMSKGLVTSEGLVKSEDLVMSETGSSTSASSFPPDPPAVGEP